MPKSLQHSETHRPIDSTARIRVATQAIISAKLPHTTRTTIRAPYSWMAAIKTPINVQSENTRELEVEVNQGRSALK